MLTSLKKLLPTTIKRPLKAFSHQCKIILYKGSKCICPICGYQSNKWASIGFAIPVLTEKQVIGAGKRSAGCYKCGSSDRERLVYLFLKHHLKLFAQAKNISLLHMAPEPSLSPALLKLKFKNYICGDLFTDGYIYPDYVQNMNLLDLPFPNNTFDLIICNHVFEHIPQDRAAMKEIFRTLKPSGQAILQVPISANSQDTVEDATITDPKQREILFGQHDHIRIYGQDYIKRLSSIGFQVQRLSISKEQAFNKYGLNENEELFIAKK